MGTLEDTKGEIITCLKDTDVLTIVLVEDTGMGRSWMAKEISEWTSNECPCYATFWVYVTDNYDINMFYNDIGTQLCVITEDWEYADKKTISNLRKDEFIQWGHTEEEMTEEKLKERIQEKLKEIGNTLSSVENKYLLLVLHDVGTNSKFDLLEKLSDNWRNTLFASKFQNRLKILITTKSADPNANQTRRVVKFPQQLQQEELSQLLHKRVDKTAVSDNQRFQSLERAIAGKSKGKPAAIIVIAETLKYIARNDASNLDSAILRAARNEKTYQGVNPLISCACDMIKNSDTKNCFWHSMQLFRNYGGIHYNELICHWIMDGYVNPSDQIEEAYQKGHGVLMELIGRALLVIQDNNIVTAEEEVLKITDFCPLTVLFLKMTDSCPLTATLRLFEVLKVDESLGRVTRMKGMIKTPCNPKVWEKNSTLLIDGSHIEIHQSNFNSMKELKVLAVFRAKSLVSSLSKVSKLLVLVLRRCDLCLEDIAQIKELKTLKVLEISGDSKLSSFPDELFDGMTDLQSLNLSVLQIKSLPSLANLRQVLRSLILTQLSCLEEVQSLKELVNLEILDLSGASSLKSMPSDLFDKITKLQSLNLSGLELIESLPSFSKLRELRVLILSRCSSLKKLQSLEGLDKLELLDISGATSFESFGDSTLSVLPKIQKIDLSKTNIQSLPGFDQLREPTHIFLSGRHNLGNLPTLQQLTS